MYQKIMVPVDLRHLDLLQKALQTAADLASHYKAHVVYVSVTSAAPSDLAHNPEEFAAKLQAFAANQASKHGIDAASSAVFSHDPAVDLDPSLLTAIRDHDCDLVVMGSHKPGFADHFFASNAAHIGGHASVSVMIVR